MQVRKALILLMMLGLIAGLVALSGCGSDKTTVKLPSGEEYSVEEDGSGSYSVETGEGDYQYDVTDEAPSEAELGVPIYPGADYVPGSGGTFSGTGPEGESALASAQFTTKDSYDEVVAFYTGELGAPLFEDASLEEASWVLGTDQSRATSLTVTNEGGQILIYIVNNMSGGMTP
jgi:hypothetical protein